MDNREANALWLLPVAYVVADRVLGFVIWQLIVVSGETSVMTPVFSLVLSVACAFAASCLCVYGHYRMVGPLSMQRSFLMAALSIPVFLVAGLATMGPRDFVRYWSQVPMQAALHYAVAFFALPAAALVMAPKQAMLARSVAPLEAPALAPPPSSAGVIVLRVVVALLSLGLVLGGGLFVIIIIGFGGSHMSGEDQAFLFAALVAVAIFGFCFLCAVGRFRRMLKIARVTVAAISLPFAAWALVEGGEEGVWAVLALGLYVGAFWAMCRGMEARP
ncbi:MAG TPA: hypothetical protein VLH12_01845 [Usitatibacter sp.]|nr:hypothetical protein [Usitatibacter sp.]